MKKILTVLIPVYNTEKYIRRCLDSILIDEIINDVEIIAVSDGSKDDSAEIIKEYIERYPNVITLIEKENGGHGSTINVGIEKANGKYFKVLDSDDWFDSKNFVEFVRKLKKCEEDLIINPYYQEYVYNGAQILFDYSKFETGVTYKFSDINLKDLNGFYFVMASSTYKLSVLKESNLRLYEKTFYVDMQYNVIPIPNVETVKFMEESLYRYFIGRPDQSMNIKSMIKNMPDHEKVLFYLIDFYTENSGNLSKIKKDYIRNIIVLMSYTHINLIGNIWENRYESYKLVKKFEKDLRKYDKEIYKEIMNYSYIKYGKKVYYMNVLICNKLFMKFIQLASKLKRRIFG